MGVLSFLFALAFWDHDRRHFQRSALVCALWRGGIAVHEVIYVMTSGLNVSGQPLWLPMLVDTIGD